MGIQHSVSLNSAIFDSSASFPTKSKKRNLPVQKNKCKHSKGKEKNLSDDKVILGLQDLKVTGSNYYDSTLSA